MAWKTSTRSTNPPSPICVVGESAKIFADTRLLSVCKQRRSFSGLQGLTANYRQTRTLVEAPAHSKERLLGGLKPVRLSSARSTFVERHTFELGTMRLVDSA